MQHTATAWYAERQRGTAALFADIPAKQLAQFVVILDTVLARLRAESAGR